MGNIIVSYILFFNQDYRDKSVATQIPYDTELPIRPAGNRTRER